MSEKTQAVGAPLERQVRPNDPVAEVVCYEIPRVDKPPMQHYEIRQFDGFRALPPGTHKIYTAPTLQPMTQAQIDHLVIEFHRTRRFHGNGPEDIVRAVETFHGIRGA